MSRTWTPGLFQKRGVRWPRRSGIKIYLNIPYLKCSNVKPSNQILPKKVSKFLNLWPFKTGLRPHIKQMDLSWVSSFLANWPHNKPFFCQKLVQEYWLLCVLGSEPICSITAEDSQQEWRGWIPGIFFPGFLWGGLSWPCLQRSLHSRQRLSPPTATLLSHVACPSSDDGAFLLSLQWDNCTDCS